MREGGIQTSHYLCGDQKDPEEIDMILVISMLMAFGVAIVVVPVLVRYAR